MQVIPRNIEEEIKLDSESFKMPFRKTEMLCHNYEKCLAAAAYVDRIDLGCSKCSGGKIALSVLPCDILSPKQTADIIGVCTATLFNWRSDGKGPPWHTREGSGRNVYYLRKEILQWMDIPVDIVETEVTEDEPEFCLSSKQAAKILNVSVAFLQRLRNRKRGPEYIMYVSVIKYSRSSVEMFRDHPRLLERKNRIAIKSRSTT